MGRTIKLPGSITILVEDGFERPPSPVSSPPGEDAYSRFRVCEQPSGQSSRRYFQKRGENKVS
jgi:hypothetical protein